jgi:phosphoribosylamine--glycine ligase
MKVLVVGSGGREHAMAWKLSQSSAIDKLYCAPGNAGTTDCAENVPIEPDHISELLDFARKEKIDLTVVGPEMPLVAGLVDIFEAEQLPVFGPSKICAKLEGSKTFTKKLMKAQGIPSADFATFDSAPAAMEYVEQLGGPCVVKAEGLAAGKGVTVCDTPDEARKAIKEIMVDRVFGSAGDSIVVEERLEGEEASILAFVDGKTIYMMDSSQDHKAVFDGDLGPNTGGMGAYSPAPCITEKLMAQIEREIFVQTVHALRNEGAVYKGILYAGVMLTKIGPKVLEFNVRMGDPETQPLLMRLKSDLFEVMMACKEGTLDKVTLDWDTRPSVCVVMASHGYPGRYEKGLPIYGISEAEALGDVKVFHAGTKIEDGKPVTSGGRVLGVTALGETIAAAKKRAYEAVKKIHFEGAHYRKDISDKAMKYLKK